MTTIATPLDAPASQRVVPEAGGVRLHFLFGTLIALLLLALLGLQNSSPPAPAPASTALDQFSAERAMVRLHKIASEPHPTGSPANERVRTYLIGELKALGLAPQVQSEMGTSALMSTAGNIHNIVLRMPGKQPGKALMLAAHYDSVPTGHGAADDGASVAAILETLRALRTSGQLKNDVIVLLTDGEESGLLGAEAFVARHPWAKDVGMVMNFEYRGNSGPMLMFETSPGNGKLVSALSQLPRAAGTSLLYEVYRLLPNDTDVSAFKRAGMPAMNFAAMETPTSYHTALDLPESLNQGTMQQQGDAMLALARHFGQADLSQLAAQDRVYFDLPGAGMVTYPVALVWPLAGLCAALLAGVLLIGVRSGALRLVRTVVAGVLVPLTGIIIAIACSLLWGGIKAIHPHYRSLFDVYNSGWYWLAFVALTIVLFTLAVALLRRWMHAMELALGTAVLWVVLLALCAKTMPGASFVLTWPLIAMLLALGWLMSARGRALGADLRLLVLLAAAAPGVILFAPLLRVLFVALTTTAGGASVFILVLLLGLMVPMIDLLKRRLVFPLLPFVAAIAFLVTGSLTGGVSATQPYTNNLVYMQDGASGNAMWLSTDAVLDSWNRPAFGEQPVMRQVPEVFGAKSRPYWTAPAPALGVKAPLVEVQHDEVVGAVRTVRLRVASLRDADELKLYAEGAHVTAATMQGRSLLAEAKDDWLFAGYKLGAEGALIEMQVTAGKPFLVRVIDTTYGLPKLNFAPRKPEMMMRPFGVSDSVRAVTSIGFN